MERVAESAKQHEPSPAVAGHGRSASPAAASLPPALELQQLAGNQAMQELLRSNFIHAKLAISNPDDPEEREADNVANTVMRKAAGAPCSCSPGKEMCEECQQKQSAPSIQRHASAPSAPSHVPRIVSDVLRSPGHPLDSATRAFFEPRFGRDFSDVRVHTGADAAASARSIHAHAYTAGSHIAFAAGQYAPETTSGRTLLAHELVHVTRNGSRISDGICRQQADTDIKDAGAPTAGAPVTTQPNPVQGSTGTGGSSTTSPTTTLPTPVVSPPPPKTVPAASPSSAEERVLPPVTLVDAKELSLPVLDIPIAKARLWGVIIEAPPPVFAVTVDVFAKVGFKLDFFYRFGPATLSDIRLIGDPVADRYSGTAKFFMPVVFGPKATLQAALSGEAAWLGLVEVLSVAGGLRAIGQEQIILAMDERLNVIYDKGTYTLSLTDSLDTGVALIFDLNAFLEANVLKKKIWSKTWNLYHWHWGRAVKVGSKVSLDYDHGRLGPVRSEPFAERFPIDELLSDTKGPSDKQPPQLAPPGKDPIEELKELLATPGGDPHLVLMAIAQADDKTKAAILGDAKLLSAVQGAVGNELWPEAQRILNKAPSETVPSLDEATVFLANRHIQGSRFQDALYVVVNHLQSTGIVDSSLAHFRYVRETTRGEALTTTHYKKDPPTGNLLPSGVSEIEIYDPAFVNVPWLYSSIMHEYVHVMQHQQVITPTVASDPDLIDRREVEAYLWEIEHSRGTGVMVSSKQMEELGKRLTEHFNSLSGATQTTYRSRYNDAMKTVKEAMTGKSSVHLGYTIEDARRIVQESSSQIGELVKKRAAATSPADKAKYDLQIEDIQRHRSEALIEVVLAENPNIQIEDRAKGIFKIGVKNAAGNIEWIYGSITVLWHLSQVSPDVFTLKATIRSGTPATLPPGTSVVPRLLVGGSGIQSRVQPFPGDIDFSEELDVTAPSQGAAGAAVAATIADFVARNSGDPNLEFQYLRIMPDKSKKDPTKDYVWPKARILDPSQHAELTLQIASTDDGRMNTSWRAKLADGRFVEITKVLSVVALSSVTGGQLFATKPSGAQFQEAYLDQPPPQLEPQTLGDYAELMRDLALKEAGKGNYLKAAKRAFNYFRAIGDLDRMHLLEPVFSTNEAEVNAQTATLEGISLALDPAYPTRILTADAAQKQLKYTAGMVEKKLPTVPGRVPPADIARELRNIAGVIEGQGGNPLGPVAPNRTTKAYLDINIEEIKRIIGMSLESVVKPIIDKYLR